MLIAALSLVVAVHAERRAGRREHREVGLECWFAQPQAEGAEPMLKVRAVNLGHRPIEIRSLYFLNSNGKAVRPSMFPEPLPKVLRDGESFNAFMDLFRIEEVAVAAGGELTHVVVADAEGNQWATHYPPDATSDRDAFAQ